MTRNLLTAMALGAGTALGASHISGEIHTVAFDPANNPYVVEKDIVVPEGKQVEIPAGCVFLFKPFAGLIVNGNLRVMGTHDNIVVFTSIYDSEHNPESSQLPNPFDWNGILITNTSVGSYFNNFSLRYSVYGIKSQSQNVVIQNGLFRQNGQFHFTIHDKIQFVQDNIPYSYGSDESRRADQAGDQKDGGKKGKAKETKGGKIARQTRIVRFACLGTAVVCTGVAAAFTVRGVRRANEINDWGPIAARPEENDTWVKIDDERRRSIVGASVFGGIAALGFVGFGVTFAF